MGSEFQILWQYNVTLCCAKLFTIHYSLFTFIACLVSMNLFKRQEFQTCVRKDLTQKKMTDEKDHGFKVADKRRYNPDGTPREPISEETTETVEKSPETESTAPSAATDTPVEPIEDVVSEADADTEPEAINNTDNVVTFPGSAGKSSPDEEPTATASPKPAAAKAAAASAVSSTQAATHQSQQAAQAAQQAAIENAYNQVSVGAGGRMPQASFLSLLNMLGVEAAMHLGLMEMQDGQRTPIDLEAARHMIDMIGILKEKTSGNLSTEEDTLLENVLADLRMQFVALSRRA
jgi:hypothetical protein